MRKAIDALARIALAAVNRCDGDARRRRRRARVRVDPRHGGRMLEPWLADGAAVTWLPVPSAIPVAEDPAARAAIRARYAGGIRSSAISALTAGASCTLLERTLQDLVVMSDCHVLLLGEGSETVSSCADRRTHPSLRRPVLRHRTAAGG